MPDSEYDGFFRRLRHTPLTTCMQGRATGSLDREAIVARTGIPTELAELVEETVRSTRLHRDEKAEVARDLAEHFRDGIERGETADKLRDDFGDPAAAAALIRRSMIRKRSWFSRQIRLATRVSLASFLVLGSLYLLIAVNDWRQKPVVAIDHVAALNAPIAAIPVSERAWPLMREGLVISRGLVAPDPDLEPGDSEADSRRRRHGMLMTQAREELPGWGGAGPSSGDQEKMPTEEIVAYFTGNHEARDKLLEAAARAHLGFELSADGPTDPLDRAFLDLGPLPGGPGPIDPLAGSVLSMRLPHLGTVRAAARMLDADARQALLAGDATRAIADFKAVLEFGRMVREPSVLISQLVGVAIDQLVYQSILDGLAARPDSFTDADLQSVLAMLADLEETRFIIDLEGERLFFDDLAQRIYTDDGTGEGRITMRGIQSVNGLGAGGGAQGFSILRFLATPMISRMMLSRSEALELWHELFDAYEVAARAPAWEIDRSSISMIDGQHLADLGANAMSSVRYFPLPLVIAAIDQAILLGHLCRADRDLAIAVVGVEAARRRLGDWPASLEQAELAGIPSDPMDGRDLGYGIIGGRPTFWSIGPDRNDDGGEAIATGNGGDPGSRRLNDDGFRGLAGYLGIDQAPDEEYDGDVVVWRANPMSISPRGVGEVED